MVLQINPAPYSESWRNMMALAKFAGAKSDEIEQITSFSIVADVGDGEIAWQHVIFYGENLKLIGSSELKQTSQGQQRFAAMLDEVMSLERSMGETQRKLKRLKK